MRTLFFLEPVIYHGNPLFLEAHFFWVEAVRRAAAGTSGNVALSSNSEVCSRWLAQCTLRGEATEVFPLDPIRPLAASQYLRSEYSKSLYGDAYDGPLVDALREVRAEFLPDLIVMTSQNNFARRAFENIPTLNIEQAPLPRFGQPLRTAFDPSGHQTGAILETQILQIKALELSANQRGSLRELIAEIGQSYSKSDPRVTEAQELLRSIGTGGKTALLVTQPPDWITYEGAYRAIELEGLLQHWSESLPDGWLGIPTYHLGFQLDESMERELAKSCPRLRFLPRHLSTGMTEPLLIVADGMVTISSTSAMTGLIFNKQVVVVGRSPFSPWAVDAPGDIDKMIPLSREEAESTLAFLTHRFSELQQRLDDDPEILSTIMTAAVSEKRPEDWFLDVSKWSIEHARTLFALP